MIGKTITYQIEVLDQKATPTKFVKKDITATVIDKVTVAVKYEQPYHIEGFNFEIKETFIPVTKYVVVTDNSNIRLILPTDIRFIHNPQPT